MPGQRRVGVGVIGYSIGRFHAQAFANIREYCHPTTFLPRLVAIAGRDRDNARAMAERMGFEKAYGGWKNLVRDKDVEVVDNTAPPYAHLEPVLMAADAGKHVVCEKPLARAAGEAAEMLRAAEKAKVKHLVGYNCRFIPAVRLAKRMIENGELGNVYLFKGSYLNIQDGYDNPGRPINWHHRKRDAGYGALSDLGTHALDLARYLVGEIAEVCGARATFIKERPVSAGSERMKSVETDDLTVASMRFRSGALGSMETTWLASGRKDYLTFEIYGSEGAVRFDLERINELEVVTRREKEELGGFRRVFVANPGHPYMGRFYAHIAAPVAFEHSFINQLHHFLSCVVDDSPVAPEGATFLDGYRNCLVMDAIAESDRAGRWVRVRG